jgi:hypothetical protein
MPAISGSFTGTIRGQAMVFALDKSGHALGLASISGTQKTSDEKWNNSRITYWATSDTVDGNGTQHGYFVNEHGDAGRDTGSFEAKVATVGGQTTLEGKWQYTGGTGDFAEITGGGTFTSRMTSPTDLVCTWQGTYELGTAKAQAV